MKTDTNHQDTYVVAASYAQERLWVMEQLENGAPTYNVQLGFRLSGTVDAAALRRALDELMRRHEVLRTHFAVEGGRLVQVIRAAAAMPLTMLDLGQSADPASAWQSRADAELRRTADLAVELPVRAHLMRLSDSDHVLLLTLDHIVCDAWSLRVLHAELTELYAAFEVGRAPLLSEPTIQYADYGFSQREWLDGGERDRQLAYWRQQLGETPPRLVLPGLGRTDGTATLTSSHDLPAELVAGLETVAAQAGVSLYSVLLAAYCILLGRYAGQDDFVVGSLVSGRNQSELNDLVGFFVNTVALRIDAGGQRTFRDLIRHVHGVALGAYEHQDVPFGRVVEELAPEGDKASEHPFFDVMFELADLSRQSADTGRLKLEPLATRTQPAPLGLVAAVLKDTDRYTCVWDFQESVIGPDTIARMQDQYLALLRAAVSEPGAAIGDLDMTTGAEREFLARGWNESEAACDASWCFADHFESVAARALGALALADESDRLSYAELDERANRLAHVLQGRGVGPEAVVGIFADGGVAQVVSVLAVLKAGGAFLPLDPAYPADRIEYMVSDARPVLLLTSGRLRGRIPALPEQGGPGILVLDDLAAELSGCPATPPLRSVRADNLAYVIYTSGSTGHPKGVAVAQRGLSVILAGLGKRLSLNGEDRVLRSASPSFDMSVLELLMAFGAGASLHIAAARNGVPADLAAFITAERITALILAPSTVAASLSDAPLPDLRTMLMGGEECPSALAARWSQGRQVFNAYGPTEATIVSAMHAVPTAQAGPVPIGHMMPGVPVYVLSEQLQPVPVGVQGELYVGGQVLARGYVGQPAVTAARFVPDPFSPLPGRRLYRTGDLVRWTADGALMFVGRKDDQVKLRGYRIELGEIEHVVRSHGNVQEAAVVLAGDEPYGQEIVCFVVLRDGSGAGEADVQAWCERSLAPFMVPARVIRIDRMPVRPSGKIDRKALVVPERAAPVPVGEASRVAPAGPLEGAIAEMWSEVLGVGDVWRGAHFFNLGGNSLSATQLIIRLRAELVLDIPIQALFDEPVFADFADMVRTVAAQVM